MFRLKIDIATYCIYMFYCNQITGVHMPVQNVSHSINNNYRINNPMLKKKLLIISP